MCLLLQRYTFWSNSQRKAGRGSRGKNCACYCKDTHFEAIHNVFTLFRLIFQLCLLLQRYTFWSNSQLRTLDCPLLLYCACYCKDTHFEAIHNCEADRTVLQPIVLATAKIHILKQFTTEDPETLNSNGLCLLLQRYTFWSNSQHSYYWFSSKQHCACYCKDTHFEAIHNRSAWLKLKWQIVLATAKIHILKQFTTPPSPTVLRS